MTDTKYEESRRKSISQIVGEIEDSVASSYSVERVYQDDGFRAAMSVTGECYYAMADLVNTRASSASLEGEVMRLISKLVQVVVIMRMNRKSSERRREKFSLTRFLGLTYEEDDECTDIPEEVEYESRDEEM